jgi:predicted transcriptional regulator
MTKEIRLLNKPGSKAIYLFVEHERLRLRIQEEKVLPSNVQDTKHSFSIDEIARDLGMDRTNVYRHVRDLHEKGLVNVIKNHRKLEVIL